MTETTVIKKKMDLDPVKVYNTKDYDIFRKKEGNRIINEKLVKTLMESILENGWYDISIIIVGENMTILDGQHRVEALKRIQADSGIVYRIKYIVSREFDDLKKIISWQADRSGWSTMDYAESFAVLGNAHYVSYLEFRKKYRLTHSVAMILLQNGGRPHEESKLFKAGKFQVTDFSIAEEWALRLKLMSDFYDFVWNRSFASAMSKFWRHPQFSHEDFMMRLNKYRSMIYACLNTEEYIQNIANMYNYRRRNQIIFDFRKS